MQKDFHVLHNNFDYLYNSLIYSISKRRFMILLLIIKCFFAAGKTNQKANMLFKVLGHLNSNHL